MSTDAGLQLFVTLAGFHALNHGMFSLARDYRERGRRATDALLIAIRSDLPLSS